MVKKEQIMRVCGEEIKGSCANLVVLEKAEGLPLIVKAVPKLSIQNDHSQEEVKTFLSTFVAFVRDNAVEQVYIKLRNKKGEFAGGPAGFKLEGLIQLLSIPVLLLSPVKIAKATKAIDASLLSGVFAYQENALRVAYAGLK